MSRARPSPRRSLAVLLVLLSLVAAINVAAAATLDVQAGKLSAFDQPVERCAASLPLGKVDNGSSNNSATVAMVGYDVPVNCVGETAHTTLYASGGAPLGSGTGTVTAPSFTMPLTPSASLANYFGTALAVGGLQLGNSSSDVLLRVVLNDWHQAYCANVVVTNVSGATITRSLSLELNGYPLNGTIYDDWGQITVSGPTSVVVGGTMAAGASVSGNYCAEREPPPSTGAPYTVTTQGTVSPSATQYCADVTVSNPTGQPLTWQVEILPDEHHPGDVYGGTIYTLWNADYTPDDVYNYDGTSFTVVGESWNATIPPFETRPFGFCVSGLQFSPPDPDPDPDPDPGDPPRFVTTVASPGAHAGTSYTASVTVTTDSTTAVPWEVTFDVPTTYGVPTDVTVGGAATVENYTAPTVTVSGSAVSASIPVTFEYSATGVAQVLPTGPGTSSGTSYSQQSQGNCSQPQHIRNVTVTSTNADWHPWQVVIPTGRNGTLDILGANGTMSGQDLTAWGTASNWAIKSGTTRTFQYCIR